MSDEYYNTHWQQLAEQEEREYNIWLDEVNNTNREIENEHSRKTEFNTNLTESTKGTN